MVVMIGEKKTRSQNSYEGLGVVMEKTEVDNSCIQFQLVLTEG
jgi:hypothetical protein